MIVAPLFVYNADFPDLNSVYSMLIIELIVLFKSLCRNEVEAKLLEKTISSEAIAYKTEWLSIRSEGGLISARIYENHYIFSAQS